MRLVVDQGIRTGESFLLEQPVMGLGRSAENDVVLRDEGVSRQHARVQRGPQGWKLKDLGSTNGTYVNGRRITDAHVLRAGDRVVLGSAMLLVQEEGQRSVPGAAEVHREVRASAAPKPALMIIGAVLVVVVLVGIVLLLVTMLQPEPQPPSGAPTVQMDQLLATLPVPTQIQEQIPGLVTRIPKDLLQFPLGATATPAPQ